MVAPSGERIKSLISYIEIPNLIFIFRMGGIYGPDEKTILGRAIYFMSRNVGYFAFCQKKDLKIDWLHIDNAVQGHVKVKFKSTYKVQSYRLFKDL